MTVAPAPRRFLALPSRCGSPATSIDSTIFASRRSAHVAGRPPVGRLFDAAIPTTLAPRSDLFGDATIGAPFFDSWTLPALAPPMETRRARSSSRETRRTNR